MQDIIEKGGRRFRVDIMDDDDGSAPWERGDGYGIVSDWTTRSKRAGERIINGSRGGLQRLYDVAATMKKAREEGWGIGQEEEYLLLVKLGRPPTKGEITARAVEKDFEFLRGWCRDEWRYVGVVVTDITDDPKATTDYSHALWGIESSEDKYLEEVAYELVDDILSEVAKADAAEQKEADEVAYWADRGVPTWPVSGPPNEIWSL